MEKETQNHRIVANQELNPADVPELRSGWKEVVQFALSYDGVQYFGDADKLRLFANNCLESYKEYGFTRKFDLDEMRALLFFFAKKYDDEKSPPTGQDMKFVLVLLEKMKEKLEAS